MRVHLPKRTADFVSNGGQVPQVFGQEYKIQNDKTERGRDEGGMISPGYKQRHEQKDERTHHQVHTWAEHVVDLPHVIGGACHGIAHWLQVVKGHTLAQQREVQLVAYLALHSLRQ